MVRLARCLLPLRLQQQPLRSLPSASYTGTAAHNFLHERKCCSYACSLLRYSSNFRRVETTSNRDFYRSTCSYRFITSGCGFYRSICSSCFISREASESASNSTSDIDVKQYKCIEMVIAEQGSVGVIVLNRPEALNALSDDLMHEVIDALQLFDEHEKVGAIVITGKGKAFAAGADIKEMKDKGIVSIFMAPFPSKWNEVSKIKKPIIAAVNGYALGGGCEVALMCDIVLAGEKALFGQPEINLGTIPGMGGTQRLIREVGKSRAMEMILTGSHFMDANEACQRGLASRVIQGNNEDLLNEAISVAKKIAQQSRPVVIMSKAAVNSAYEIGLQEGIKKEQALFGATFALEDRKEGMSAFVEKRKPLFKHG